MKLGNKFKGQFSRIVDISILIAAIVSATLFLNDRNDEKIQAAENRAITSMNEIKDDLGRRIDEVTKRLDRLIEIQLGDG